MHREIRSIERPFSTEQNLSLYLLTLLVGLGIALELGPWLGTLLQSWTGYLLPLPPPGINLFGKTITWAMIIAVFGVMRTGWSSSQSFMEGRSGADLAMAIAIFASILLNQPLVGAEVFFIGLLGECLEAYTFGRTQKAISKLVETCPRMCLVLRNGEEVKIPVEQLALGERVRVLPGKRIPVDGVIVEGTTSIDLSNLTGESVPVDKQPGDAVLAGTVNQFGSIVVEAKAIAEHSLMGRVIEMTAKALTKKGEYETTADRYARVFLYVVLSIAAVTFLFQLWWLKGSANLLYRAASPALAVLVVACPCALILATPAAAMAALARLAKTGVLVKSAAALERLAGVTSIAFDKTGTLTTGKMQLGEVYAPSGSPEQLLKLAASVEQRSEHPLAMAIVTAAKSQNITLESPEEFSSLPGAGVKATLWGREVLIGSLDLMQKHGVPLSETSLQQIAKLDAAGQTALLIAVNQQLQGVIGIWDTVRPEAAATIEELKQLGIDVRLLTGDRSAAAQAIASRVGISEVQAELLPQDKATAISKLQSNGKQVAMIGDGVNDAPALAQAQAGLAIGGTGSDIAAEAGDFILMGDPLKPLGLLFRLSRQMVTILKQNILWFALGVNIVGIVLVGWLFPAWSEEAREKSPLWAAFYHQIGSLLVLLNSMRLLWFERGETKLGNRFSQLSQSVDGWLEKLSPHEISHWIIDHRRGVGLATLALMLLTYLATSIVTIPADSVGIVQRCGQVQEATLPPGLHFTLPWPFDKVHRIAAKQLRQVEVGFRTLSTNPQDAGALTWTSSHGGSILVDKEETLFVTGDGSLLEIQATVSFTLSDPKKFLFDVSDAERIVKSLAESALRETAGALSFSAMLYEDRQRFARQAETRLRSKLEQSNLKLGMEIVSINLLDVHPPQQVVPDYYEVTKSLSERSRVVTEAQINKEEMVSTEKVAKTRMQAEALANLNDRQGKAKAERDAFLALTRLAWSGPMQALTLFHYTVEAAEATFSGRPKILHDPKLGPPLQVIPEALRFRLPSLGDRLPSERNLREPPGTNP